MGVSLVLAVSACGEAEVNPPTEPAQPVTEATARDAFGPAGQGAVYRPGTGPASFVGRWAEDVSACPRDPGGAGTPVEITVSEVRGNGVDCDIASIAQIGDSYDATLLCPSRQRVRLTVADHVLTALYLAPEVRSVTLSKCTTLADTNPDEGPAPRVLPPA